MTDEGEGGQREATGVVTPCSGGVPWVKGWGVSSPPPLTLARLGAVRWERSAAFLLLLLLLPSMFMSERLSTVLPLLTSRRSVVSPLRLVLPELSFSFCDCDW